MGIYKGIDISLWQKNIDFNAVKASGIDFVIINAGYGHSISQNKTTAGPKLQVSRLGPIGTHMRTPLTTQN